MPESYPAKSLVYPEMETKPFLQWTSKARRSDMQERAYEMRFIDGTFVRSARKQHGCAKCKSKIVVGEEYAEYVGEVGPYSSGVRYCLSCAATQLVDRDR